ncbi:hypothetical protein [Deinococcus psychrotolerans]|uniref:hypothetical protein n=1 Tax=Deinococcus psychrotolerans TaxID=2489213 RepID=UPI0013DE789F|nr:hypothetical protein [Deinococcus psychrotolerans]
MSPEDNNSMKAVRIRLNVIIGEELSFKPIQCPSYLLDMNDSRDIRGCFISELEPEAIIPLLLERFEKFTDVQMGWRMDLGTWVTYRVVKKGQQSFAMSLTAPGINVDMRNDPKVNQHKTVGKYFIPHDDVK